MKKDKQEHSLMIREIKEEDAKELFDMLNDLDDKTKGFFHPHEFDLDTLKKICKSKDDHYYVMLMNGKIVGYSFLRLFGYKIPSLGILIRRSFTKKGLGTILIKWTIERARKLNYKKVILKTYKDNYPAQRLYEKIGFKVFGETEDNKEYKMEFKL